MKLEIIEDDRVYLSFDLLKEIPIVQKILVGLMTPGASKEYRYHTIGSKQEKIPAIKDLRTWMGLDFKTAKETVEGLLTIRLSQEIKNQLVSTLIGYEIMEIKP